MEMLFVRIIYMQIYSHTLGLDIVYGECICSVDVRVLCAQKREINYTFSGLRVCVFLGRSLWHDAR